MSADQQKSTFVYKICRADDWAAAVARSNYSGSAVDVRDGFIHFSTGPQLAETARRHFVGQPDLVLAAFAASSLGDELKWEVSRGGALFPHLYAGLPTAAALWVKRLELDAAGVPVLPEGVV